MKLVNILQTENLKCLWHNPGRSSWDFLHLPSVVLECYILLFRYAYSVSGASLSWIIRTAYGVVSVRHFSLITYVMITLSSYALIIPTR